MTSFNRKVAISRPAKTDNDYGNSAGKVNSLQRKIRKSPKFFCSHRRKTMYNMISSTSTVMSMRIVIKPPFCWLFKVGLACRTVRCSAGVFMFLRYYLCVKHKTMYNTSNGIFTVTLTSISIVIASSPFCGSTAVGIKSAEYLFYSADIFITQLLKQFIFTIQLSRQKILILAT